ncbi:MAG: ATP-binding domain-containing protein [Fusobacterium mortiferum]|nr:ATP-binding domain-containing protein [Fusobacterium mortiferum]
MVTIITGTTKKPVSSERLKKFFQNHEEFQGYLYIGYPIIGTIEGAYPIDCLWISPDIGLVVFNLIEGKEIEGYQEIQDDCANKIEAKLKGYRELVNKRNLCVEINIITYAPAIGNKKENDNDYPLCSTEYELEQQIKKLKWENKSYYQNLVSVLQAISTIRKGKKRRETTNSDSRGTKLKKLEDSIANLDNQQSRAVIETVEGVQRIRGLAGSGKTIVLALKAAYLHAQHPEWKIAITFNTRSLKGQLRQLINTFYIEQTNEEPNWENINIVHAWGAPGGGEKNGIYYMFCNTNNVEYYDFITAKNKFGLNDPFGEACNKALADTQNISFLYDVILIDEAQDFSPAFLKLCYEMLKPPKRLVYAYDELQNLRLQSLPAPEEIFGTENGKPRVVFKAANEGEPQQDIILEKCYRNSRPTLVTAHALGFGIYRKPKESNKSESNLVQMFDQSSLWNDIGYEVEEGTLEEGKRVVLKRTNTSSPVFLENHSPIDDLIIFKKFNTKEEQDNWVAEEIRKNLREDELRSDDIIVINPNPVTTKLNVAPIRSLLFQKGIQTHTAGVDTAPDIFFSENNDSIAFTGIYRAKGNEAGMVYIVNAETCFDSHFDLAKLRNQLFTAITRSKAWVRVLGVGDLMEGLIEEYEKVKKHNFTLEFIYPTKEQRNHMNIINRDMSEAEKNKIKENNRNILNLISEIKNGDIRIEDINGLNELLSLLNQKGGINN